MLEVVTAAGSPGLRLPKMLPANGIVTFNVGGTFHATSIETLAKDSQSWFAGLIRFGLPREQPIFVDRDGERFRVVLNYLRSGTLHLGASKSRHEEILEEAEFFCLQGLSKLLLERIAEIEEEENQRKQRLKEEKRRDLAALARVALLEKSKVLQGGGINTSLSDDAASSPDLGELEEVSSRRGQGADLRALLGILHQRRCVIEEEKRLEFDVDF